MPLNFFIEDFPVRNIGYILAKYQKLVENKQIM